MARKSFNFYDYFYEPIKHFKEIDRASIIIAIIEYCLYEKEPDWLNDVCKFAFNTLKPKLDLNIMRSKVGQKGGAPIGNKNAEKTTKKQPKNNQKTTKILEPQQSQPQLFTDDEIKTTETITSFLPQNKEKRTKKENTLNNNIYNYIYNIYNIDGKKNFLKLQIEEREKIFYEHLIPFVREQGGEYDREMVREFYDYWSEINQQGTKMRWEEQETWETAKRLSMWSRKNNQYSKNNYGTTINTRRNETETERRNREAREALFTEFEC